MTVVDDPPPEVEMVPDGPEPRDLSQDELDAIEAANREKPASSRARTAAALEVPHDHDAEAALLGAAMANPDATSLVLQLVDHADLHLSSHQAVHHAISTLHADGVVPTPVTVADQLGTDGLDRIGGRNRLIDLQTAAYEGTTGLGSLPGLAAVIARHAHHRRLLAGTLDLQQAITTGDPTRVSAAITDLLDRAGPTTSTTSSWDAQDLTGLTNGGITRPTPTMLPMDDDEHHLLYPGKIHAFNAESESGKSWLALWACAIEIAAGHHTLYIDFEDDAPGVTDRLLDLGLTAQEIVDRFHYVRPDEAHDAQAAAALQALIDTHQPTLAILDGVTEALVMNGWSINDNDDAAAFAVRILRPIADAGPAVVLIDHLPKDKDTQGSHAIGAQHKKAFITGAAYKLDVREAFGRGRTGKARLTVTKDRPGAIRGWCVSGKVAGDFILSSTPDGDLKIHLQRADEQHPGENPFRPTHLMEMVSNELIRAGDAPSKSALQTRIPGRRKPTFQAIDALIDEGFITVEPGPRGATRLHLDHPYTESADPLSDRFDPGPDDPGEQEF